MTHCKIGKITLKPSWPVEDPRSYQKRGRYNSGYSYGLQFPFLYGSMGGRWLVWNRHSGKIFWESNPNGNTFLEESKAQAVCRDYNGLQEEVDASILDDIDQSP